MPIHIDELLGKTDEDYEYITQYLVNMVFSSHPDNYSGSRHGTDHAIAMIAFNIPDKNTKEDVMRCVFTMKSDEDTGALDILDIDVVMVSDNAREIEFREHVEGFNVNEYWVAGVDAQACEVETINRYLISGSLKDETRKASFSVFPFRYMFGDTVEDINIKLGWDKGSDKPMRFTEDFLATCESFPKAYGERFSVLMCKIVSYKKVLLEVEEKEFEAIIATADTALGQIPVFIDPDYEDELKENVYLLVFADIKADLATDDLYYYDMDKNVEITEEEREKLNELLGERGTE